MLKRKNIKKTIISKLGAGSKLRKPAEAKPYKETNKNKQNKNEHGFPAPEKPLYAHTSCPNSLKHSLTREKVLPSIFLLREPNYNKTSTLQLESNETHKVNFVDSLRLQAIRTTTCSW